MFVAMIIMGPDPYLIKLSPKRFKIIIIINLNKLIKYL